MFLWRWIIIFFKNRFERLNVDYEVLKKKDIPLLYKDDTWMELFGKLQDPEIKDLSNRLVNLKIRERSQERVLRDYLKEKNECMKFILKISDAVNNEEKIEGLKLLDEYKKRLLMINEEIDKVEFELETLPDEIRSTNYDLVNLTIQRGYEELYEREKTLEKTNEDLIEIRDRLRELIELKSENEKWISQVYSFLHGLLGREIIDSIDEQVFE